MAFIIMNYVRAHRNLSKEHALLIYIAAPLCGLCLLYVVLQFNINRLHQQNLADLAFMRWLKQTLPHLIQYDNTFPEYPIRKSEPIKYIVHNQLKLNHLDHLEPKLTVQSPHELEIVFKHIYFSKLYQLLVNLWEDQQITAKKMHLVRLQTGSVCAQISLTRIFPNK